MHVYECGLHFLALSCRSRSVIGSRAVECIRKIDASVFDAEKAPSQVGEGPGELAYGSGFNVPVVSLASSCACYDASVFRDVFAQRLRERAARIRLRALLDLRHELAYLGPAVLSFDQQRIHERDLPVRRQTVKRGDRVHAYFDPEERQRMAQSFCKRPRCLRVSVTGISDVIRVGGVSPFGPVAVVPERALIRVEALPSRSDVRLFFRQQDVAQTVYPLFHFAPERCGPFGAVLESEESGRVQFAAALILLIDIHKVRPSHIDPGPFEHVILECDVPEVYLLVARGALHLDHVEAAVIVSVEYVHPAEEPVVSEAGLADIDMAFPEQLLRLGDHLRFIVPVELHLDKISVPRLRQGADPVAVLEDEGVVDLAPSVLGIFFHPQHLRAPHALAESALAESVIHAACFLYCHVIRPSVSCISILHDPKTTIPSFIGY